MRGNTVRKGAGKVCSPLLPAIGDRVGCGGAAVHTVPIHILHANARRRNGTAGGVATGGQYRMVQQAADVAVRFPAGAAPKAVDALRRVQVVAFRTIPLEHRCYRTHFDTFYVRCMLYPTAAVLPAADRAMYCTEHPGPVPVCWPRVLVSVCVRVFFSFPSRLGPSN